ncbi:SPOR domain-containing protein [Parabacteroides sp. FAFU027]|uniref:SPOR domain-containing protein n=1 Tax=Parabacteroides sp. FAFU027 TaxID=2922715 RepID=UPI001FAEF5BD|nr:SPOR domain-containing protein [Parabacteroides sp. FAFU027]
MRKIVFLLFIVMQVSAFALKMQNDSVPTIIQSLEEDEIGKGKVKIYQDSRILNLIGKKKTGTIARTSFTVGKGFRVQIYSGNNQNVSKREAFQREATIKRDFSDIETYITFKSPFWRLRVGNFRSYEEAYETMRKIKEAYPHFGKETYIVKDDIKIYH